MRALTLSLTAIMLVSLVFVSGCAVNKARSLVARGSAAEGSNWGKTILVCEVDYPAQTEDERQKIGRITTLVKQAIAARQGVELVGSDALSSRLGGRSPMAASDGELAAAALDAGADTVVLVRVLGYGGELTISLLPPFWSTGTDFTYYARVIDARTGALYLDAHRGRKKSGAFTAHTSRELGEDFGADLTALFSGPATGTPVQNGSGS